MLDDQQLVEQVLAGDDDAFATLVQLHQTAVYNIAYRMVGQCDTAQSLTQETFLRAFRALDTFDLNRPFGPWLYRIATNLSINWIKRARLPTVSIETPPKFDRAESEPFDIPDSSAEPAERFAQAEMQAELRQVVVSLPVEYRSVIELRHFQELNYVEIASTLKLPVSTVKTRLFRARRMLRDRLESLPKL